MQGAVGAVLGTYARYRYSTRRIPRHHLPPRPSQPASRCTAPFNYGGSKGQSRVEPVPTTAYRVLYVSYQSPYPYSRDCAVPNTYVPHAQCPGGKCPVFALGRKAKYGSGRSSYVPTYLPLLLYSSILSSYIAAYEYEYLHTYSTSPLTYLGTPRDETCSVAQQLPRRQAVNDRERKREGRGLLLS